MAKHSEDKKYNTLLVCLIILVLLILGIISYLYIFPILSTKFNILDASTPNTGITQNKIIEHTSTTYKVIEDAQHLHSDELDLTVNNGISTINGKIFNTSNEVVHDLNCLYTLKDSDNNTVYEFTIYAKQIDPQGSFGFTSVVILDLSTVADYTVKLFK